MNTQEKLRIIRNWTHKFEFVNRPHVKEGVTGIMYTGKDINYKGRHTVTGSYEITCETEEEVIHAAYRALQEHVWWKIQHFNWQTTHVSR
jgi:hypothetical protein